MSRPIATAVALVTACLVVSCTRNTPANSYTTQPQAQPAGGATISEEGGSAVDQTRSGVEGAADAAKKGAERAGEAAREGAEDAKDAAEDAEEDMSLEDMELEDEEADLEEDEDEGGEDESPEDPVVSPGRGMTDEPMRPSGK